MRCGWQYRSGGGAVTRATFHVFVRRQTAGSEGGYEGGNNELSTQSNQFYLKCIFLHIKRIYTYIYLYFLKILTFYNKYYCRIL